MLSLTLKLNKQIFASMLLLTLLTISGATCTNLHTVPTAAGAVVLSSVHDSPKKMVERFIRTLRTHPPEDLASAFENSRRELKLTREVTGDGQLQARWSNRTRFFSLLGGHPLGSRPGTPDYEKRFYLQLIWSDAKSQLSLSDLQALLGQPYGVDDSGGLVGWVINGGLLKARLSGTNVVSYVVYDSPVYVKDPLNVFEAPNLPKLPDWEKVEGTLNAKSLFQYHEKTTTGGWKEKEFCFTNMTTSPEKVSKCVTRYLSMRAGKPYLVGLKMTMITPRKDVPHREEYASMFQDLDVPNSRELIDGLFAAPASETDSREDPLFTLQTSLYESGNFSLLRQQQNPRPRKDMEPYPHRFESIYVWRRIEIWPQWRSLARPDTDGSSISPR